MDAVILDILLARVSKAITTLCCGAPVVPRKQQSEPAVIGWFPGRAMVDSSLPMIVCLLHDYTVCCPVSDVYHGAVLGVLITNCVMYILGSKIITLSVTPPTVPYVSPCRMQRGMAGFF